MAEDTPKSFFGSDVKLGPVIYSGEASLVTITNGTEGSIDISRGLLMENYNVSYAKSVSGFKPLNSDTRVAQHGLPVGGLTFSGLIGTENDINDFLTILGDPKQHRRNLITLHSTGNVDNADGTQVKAGFGMQLLYCALNSINLSASSGPDGLIIQRGTCSIIFYGLVPPPKV